MGAKLPKRNYERLSHICWRLTIAFDVVVNEVTRIGALVSPSKTTVTVLASFYVVSFVRGTIGPGLKTLTVLLIFLPLSTVLSAI